MTTTAAAPTTSTVIPAAVYARVSLLRQVEDWHKSLDAQVAECLAYAPRNGHTADPEYVVKEPFTGTTLDRPLFERLITQMERRGIHHLIMDKPDRVNRSGQQDAAYFMRRLWDADVTLSFALINFVVRPGDELAQRMFLNYALFAKLDNAQRVSNVQRARQQAARLLGRYVKGNRPPYGWRLEPAETDSRGRAVTFRLVHDDKPGGTYPVLVRILRERQAGRSYKRIAAGLTADGVPTSAAHAGLRNASPTKDWHPSSVKIIVHDPINAGVVAAFRSRTVVAPPDVRHTKRWKRQVPVPPSEQIMLPSDLVVDPPLTPAEYQWLISPAAYALSSDGSARTVPQGGSTGGPRGHSKAADLAMGHGGLFRHAACGGTLRVNYSAPGKTYTYYACQRHADVPGRCPGFTVLAPVLDSLVWDAVVRDVLLAPGKLAELAERQRQADLAGQDPQSEVRRLREMRADLLERRANLADSISRQKDAFVRATLEEQLGNLGPQLADAEQRLEDAQRRTTNEDQRQAVLADVQAQVGRYALVLHFAPLLPTPYRVAVQRRVLRALGLRATVDKTADGRLDVAAELRLAAGQPGLWFTADDAEGIVQAGAREGLTGLTGLFAPGAMPEMEEPVSEQALLEFLGAAGASLPTLPAEAAEAAPVGTVRFVTTTSSPCP
jgi:DNA invertase Pin-like site-specific DNA recombinase